MTNITVTAYNWTATGYNALYTTSNTAQITDNDSMLEGSSDPDEMVSIDGGTPVATGNSAYAIDVDFVDANGDSHTETFNFFYTDAWYFVPAADSQFSVGATLGTYQSHTNGWSYSDVACFANGTLIDTPNGPVPVEDLRPGMLVQTRCQSALPLRLNLRHTLCALELHKNPKLAPVRIDAGALGPGCPSAPLWVSRQHRMLVASPICERMLGQREVLVAAIHLTNLPGCSVDLEHPVQTYHHLVFDTHAIVTANGAPSESFLPGDVARGVLSPAATAEFEALFPDQMPQNAQLAARLIPRRAKQKRLIERHAKNRKPLIHA